MPSEIFIILALLTVSTDADKFDMLEFDYMKVTLTSCGTFGD